MSVTRLTYCGPYIECKVKKTMSTFSKRTCPKAECGQHGANMWHDTERFCKECGTAIAEVSEEVEGDAVDFFDVMDEPGVDLESFYFGNEDRLSQKGIHVWIVSRISRLGKKPQRDLYVYDDDNSLDSITPQTIPSELEEFSRKARKELAWLRERYGADRVEVKWGILHTCHC